MLLSLFLSSASSIVSIGLATWSTVLQPFQNPACSLGNSLSTMGSIRVKSMFGKTMIFVGGVGTLRGPDAIVFAATDTAT